MSYTPQHVANFFLKKAEADGRSITQLKLLKLIYIAYGWYLALKGEKLFDEPIEAWQHGPVVPSIYHEFKHFGKRPIIGKSMDIDFDDDELEWIFPEIPESDEDTNLILGKVWAAYRKFSGWDLRNKTHEPDGPWAKVYKDGEFGIALSDEDIKRHYLERIRMYIDNT